MTQEEIDKLFKWLHKSKARNFILQAVRRLNKSGCHPNGAAVIRSAGMHWCKSVESNARIAIRQLLDTGWIKNVGTKHNMGLTCGPLLGVISDALEEMGKPRLDWLESEL
jgi:hypothetical protein